MCLSEAKQRGPGKGEIRGCGRKVEWEGTVRVVFFLVFLFLQGKTEITFHARCFIARKKKQTFVHTRMTGFSSMRPTVAALACLVALLVLCPTHAAQPAGHGSQVRPTHVRGRALPRLHEARKLPPSSNTLAAPGQQGLPAAHGVSAAFSDGQASTPASIVIAVTSPAPNHERRARLRQWHAACLQRMRTRDPIAADTVILRFLMGGDVHGPALTSLMAEHKAHGDLLFLPGVPDADDPDPPPTGTPSATTLKVAHAARWAAQTYDTPWFVRSGDDAYFRVDYFLGEAVQTLSKKRLMLGYCSGLHYKFAPGPPPVAKADLPYCSGMGYVWSQDVLTYVASNSHILSMAYPEDATVASWFVGTHIQIVHDARFSDWVWQTCGHDSIIIHKLGEGAVVEEVNGTVPSCFPHF